MDLIRRGKDKYPVYMNPVDPCLKNSFCNRASITSTATNMTISRDLLRFILFSFIVYELIFIKSKCQVNYQMNK